MGCRYEDQLQEQRRQLMAELSQHSSEAGALTRAERERLEDELHKARQVRQTYQNCFSCHYSSQPQPVGSMCP